MTIKTHTESSKTELSSKGKRLFKVWRFFHPSGVVNCQNLVSGKSSKLASATIELKQSRLKNLNDMSSSPGHAIPKLTAEIDHRI